MHLHTKKQRQYFYKVMRLHYEHGYGEDRISRILPIGHSTVSRWIGIFAAEKEKRVIKMRRSKSPAQPPVVAAGSKDVRGFESEVARTQSAFNHGQTPAQAPAVTADSKDVQCSESEDACLQSAFNHGQTPAQAPAVAAESKDVKFLESEVARLQSALNHGKLRADAYDEMIQVAETGFKIEIRKKVGAKR
jgi:hypothetical protein